MPHLDEVVPVAGEFGELPAESQQVSLTMDTVTLERDQRACEGKKPVYLVPFIDTSQPGSL